jgi:tRNA A-37 threonylcarbamoyl transferase component Bud32
VKALDNADVPSSYVRFRSADAVVVALASLADCVREAMRDGSLYDYAAHHPRTHTHAGRGAAYAVSLPDGVTRVVIRRSRHGGWLAPLTGDRFLPPTRAPREMESSLRLRRLGIPTPEIVAYAVYPAGSVWRRADVATREVPDGQDLGTFLLDAPDAERKREALGATATLVARLTAAGARHPDLNVSNVLLARDENERLEAWVLDLDRVWFADPSPRVTDANLRRLRRSALKWQRDHGAAVDESDLLWLAGAVDVELHPGA